MPDIPAALVDEAARRIHASPATGTQSLRHARADAVELLDLATGGEGADRPLSAAERGLFTDLLGRRLRGEPMALLAGHVDFLDLDLRVRPGVFAPRQSSALLVGAAVARLRPRRTPTLVDVATGAGTVALAVAGALPRARVLGTDISADAVAVARDNARRNGIGNAAFRRGDLLDGLPRSLRGSVDVVTCHPPYVPAGEIRLLPREVGAYEPLSTLTDGSPDGLGMIRRLAEAAADWLVPGGWLLLEVSPDRGRGATAVMRRHLTSVQRLGARGDVTRVVAGRRPPERRPAPAAPAPARSRR